MGQIDRDLQKLMTDFLDAVAALVIARASGGAAPQVKRLAALNKSIDEELAQLVPTTRCEKRKASRHRCKHLVAPPALICDHHYAPRPKKPRQKKK